MDQQSVQLPHDVHDYQIDIDQIIENVAKETEYKPDELMDLLPSIEWEKNPIKSVKYILGDICKFDEIAYAEQYPDIQNNSSITPLDHYIMYGFKENRQFHFVRDKLGTELSPRNTSQGMLEILKQYDVISFDIFDTVLFRKVEFPDKIFDIMSLEMGWSDFSDARKFAETDAREKSEQTYGHREIVLDDIYQILYTKFNIEPHWKLREIELEEKSSLRNDFIFKIYVKLLEAGKEIIFVSDMYLPLDVIKKLLKINGYFNISIFQLFIEIVINIVKYVTISRTE